MRIKFHFNIKFSIYVSGNLSKFLYRNALFALHQILLYNKIKRKVYFNITHMGNENYIKHFGQNTSKEETT